MRCCQIEIRKQDNGCATDANWVNYHNHDEDQVVRLKIDGQTLVVIQQQKERVAWIIIIIYGMIHKSLPVPFIMHRCFLNTHLFLLLNYFGPMLYLSFFLDQLQLHHQLRNKFHEETRESRQEMKRWKNLHKHWHWNYRSILFCSEQYSLVFLIIRLLTF